MEHCGFVHLRVHSAYSMAEGALRIPRLVELCQANAMPAAALTDTRNLFGALEFSVASAEAGIQPIIGCVLAVEAAGQTGRGAGDARKPEPDTVVLLAQNETGYLNLLDLVSVAFLETDGTETPHVSFDQLKAKNDGLLLLTGGHTGPIGRLLRDGRKELAEQTLTELAQAYDGRTYVEIQRHGLAEEAEVEAPMIDLAYALDLPLVATNDCMFDTEAMFEAHDALICIAEKSFVSVQGRRRMTPEHRFKSADDMRATFADLPEAIDNTVAIAQRCAFMSERRDPILPRSPQVGDRTEEQALKDAAEAGLEERLSTLVYTENMPEDERIRLHKEYFDRLEYELGVIENMGFPGYFLIVADFIQWAKDHSIPVGPGRGSGAGSVVAWALTITDLDPLRFNLLFERFLNPERVSMPDFDIDFCQDRREEVIRYVQEEYGRDKVAQIITFGKLQARAVLRNVGRVLEMPLGYVDKICKLVPMNPANPVKLQEAIDGEPELQRLRDEDPNVAQLLDIGLKLEGLYSHASTHAAGVVIGDRPLHELVPLYRDPHSDMPVTQFNMAWVEQAGLVKFDFLGLKTLTVLEKAVELLALRDIDLDLSTMPLDDKHTFDMLSKGDAMGVFQLESQGMRQVLKELKPDVFEDIIAVVALYRPGPMDNIPSFINRKNGGEQITYMHESLEPILKETYGIMIYQEQVMQAAQELAGYSLGGADLLRRAMGKKKKEEMDRQRQIFVEGCGSRGIPDGQANGIFDTIAKFAGYGFNKSHAAAYALIAYQTGYLKANHPVEFMAASMTFDMQNTDKLAAFKAELTRLGIDCLPPDVNKSLVDFAVENGAVRYALAAVKNVGEGAMASLVKERDANGPFKDLSDFARRLDSKVINKRLLENLAAAGALDSLEPDRAKVHAGAETLMRHAQAATEDRNSQQASMFDTSSSEAPEIMLPAAAEWRPMEKLTREFDAIGFYLSAHPLDAYRAQLDAQNVLRANEIETLENRDLSQPLKMAGTLVSKRERTDKAGRKFAFVMLSDDTGSFEVAMFSDVYAGAREVLDSGQPLLLTLDARMRDDQLRLSVTRAEGLDNALSATTTNLRLVLSDMRPITELQGLLAEDKRGNGRVILQARSNGHIVELELPDTYGLGPTTLAQMKDIPGITEIRPF